MDYAERSLLKSQRELSMINKGLKRAGGDQKKMSKELKKIKKYFRSPLAEVARIDGSLYNVRERTQGANANQGPADSGVDSTSGESPQA